ncbi:MerR family transcriptional regulator [Thalassospira lucentensis]|jgi:DNA-binding transcriptional MerR regulator|uniref:DNA-binding transcriptional regulator, MerR family n=3 Tax=Thalassospira TaxID=168934 RepID=A0A154KNQ4_9PROT|nr:MULTISPECIES: MerR family DNA-binding transcriptional regulator [Thalassospira]KZB51153.1 MerR family transcriptional regulator [Thalassospira xiamenensis]KZB69154.1 MerR family transcriptional regulator [Thalassospira lucentensis]MAZ35693.1 MerR family transcriptional regulator [Thalassospira sp.]MCH2274021.1 MerR family DNA-binding transcriptional regulator [Thalassospira sp.]MCK2167811.1 MerR family DNA-binding transcriptional regulator [Thalassospira xiamenensis]|tara:strand:+ start:483 stop:863 length:381 start_codon:yes stop_codon:yes gene_type:complete
MNDSYSITDLAREFDVTTRTIRFYEDQELIAPARQGQTRIYSQRDRVRLRLIMRGKRLGFSLKEIRDLLDLYDTDRSEIMQLTILVDKINERRDTLRKQRQDIDATLDELDKLEETCQEELTRKSG